MPRFWTFSDLHQNWADNAWDPSRCVPPGGFDALLVAGDVHSPLTAALDWLHARFPGTKVLYTPGNHDHWTDANRDDKFTFADQIAWGRDLAARYGIDLLIDDTVTVDGVRVIGTTLWTDLALGPAPFAHAAKHAQRTMFDYRRIRRRSAGPHKYVRTGDLLAVHRTSLAYVTDRMSQPHDGPTVVMTHHAPSARSLNADVKDLPWCYATALDDLIVTAKPDVWVHGHVHGRFDYRIGDTRIVCNALGNREQASRKVFDPTLVIDLP
ncbi:metallophosphoesterase [Lichenifustis flavocetrariae]|uniref:Metallophosphoesterase n=1 Tax=Lichenifustis flavocetrariae TaxID=2949735 RepID=A0AA41YWG8_9HYPH|nr:metallophosphoesterase [Lichenifustis flavocetrariae]MCW6509861.1 metallophosphoesterase [Lichenifustis flavocetrariae]